MTDHDPASFIASEVLRIAEGQSTFDGWVSFSGEAQRQRAARKLHEQGHLERVKASTVLPYSVGYAYRIPRDAPQDGEGGEP